MSQVISSEVLARKPKKRVEWVLKRLKDELAAPGTNRDIIYEVLTRKEGRAFAAELVGSDAQRVYAAVMQTFNAFTTRQQRQLQSNSFVLRQLHDQEQERLAGLLSPPVVREVPKPLKTAASVGTPPGPPPTKATGSNRNAATDLRNPTSKQEVSSLTQSIQSDLELLRGAVSNAKEATARRKKASSHSHRHGSRSRPGSHASSSEDETGDMFNFSLVSPPRGDPKKESRQKGGEVAATPSPANTGQVGQQHSKEAIPFRPLQHGDVKKGDIVIRDGEEVEVIDVDYRTDPVSYTVRRNDGSEVGTELSRLRLPRQQAPPAPASSTANTATPTAIPVTSTASASINKNASDTQCTTSQTNESEKLEEPPGIEECQKEKAVAVTASAPAKADEEDFLAPDEPDMSPCDLHSPGCTPPASPRLLQSPGCTPPGSPELKQSPDCCTLASPDVLETKVGTDTAAVDTLASQAQTVLNKAVEEKVAPTAIQSSVTSENTSHDKQNENKTDSSQVQPLAKDDVAEEACGREQTTAPVPEERSVVQPDNSVIEEVTAKEVSTSECQDQKQQDASRTEQAGVRTSAIAEETDSQIKQAVLSAIKESSRNSAFFQAQEVANQTRETSRGDDTFKPRKLGHEKNVYRHKSRETTDSAVKIRRREEAPRKHRRKRDVPERAHKVERHGETSRKHRTNETTDQISDGRKRKRRETEKSHKTMRGSPTHERPLPPPATVPKPTASPLDIRNPSSPAASSATSRPKHSSDSCVFSRGSMQTRNVAPPPPPLPQGSTQVPRESRETKRRVLSTNSARPATLSNAVKLYTSGSGDGVSRSRSRDGFATVASSSQAPESFQWSPEKRKKEMLREQLAQKTREVQALRNKLLSKRLEQASFANRNTSAQLVTAITLPRPSTTAVDRSVFPEEGSNSFKPPPPLKQSLGGSSSSASVGQKVSDMDSLRPTEPVADTLAPSFTRRGTNRSETTAVVEVEAREELPGQRRAKAPEVCWDLRRMAAGSGHSPKVKLQSERLDGKKKLLQELMQKRRSLRAEPAAATGSSIATEAPAIIDLS